MVTLSKRATPSQERILRIVEGAVLNAYDAHGASRDTWFARSIAKRAAGTLSTQWSEVLSVNSRLTARRGNVGFCRACERRKHLVRLRARREHAVSVGGDKTAEALGRARWEASQLLRRLPLLELWERLKREMWAVSRGENRAKYDAYVNLLRMIDKLHKDLIAAEMS